MSSLKCPAFLPDTEFYIKCTLLHDVIEMQFIMSAIICVIFFPPRITDLANIKRRLYLSTVHKELFATPLHAKIPLSIIKRKVVSMALVHRKCIYGNAYFNEI